jgi:hypothetical protein
VLKANLSEGEAADKKLTKIAESGSTPPPRKGRQAGLPARP